MNEKKSKIKKNKRKEKSKSSLSLHLSLPFPLNSSAQPGASLSPYKKLLHFMVAHKIGKVWTIHHCKKACASTKPEDSFLLFSLSPSLLSSLLFEKHIAFGNKGAQEVERAKQKKRIIFHQSTTYSYTPGIKQRRKLQQRGSSSDTGIELKSRKRKIQSRGNTIGRSPVALDHSCREAVATGHGPPKSGHPRPWARATHYPLNP